MQDEVFHVRQAKNYVQGKWNIWDPKITTPPGLYVPRVEEISFWRLITVAKVPLVIPYCITSTSLRIWSDPDYLFSYHQLGWCFTPAMGVTEYLVFISQD